MTRRPLPYHESSLHSRPFALLVLALLLTFGILPVFASSSSIPLFATAGITPPVAYPPGVRITMSQRSFGPGETATVTFTFPGTPVDFTLADLTAENGALSDLAVTSNPNIYTATFTADMGITDSTNMISLVSKEVMTTFPRSYSFSLPGILPHAIAFDGTNMWAPNFLSSNLSKFGPDGTQTIYPGIGNEDQGIASDGTNMWVPNNDSTQSVTKIAPDGTTTTYTGTGLSPVAIAYDGTNMWTANETDNSVTKIAPDGTMTTYTGTGTTPYSIAFDGTNMWTANVGGNSVTKIAPDGTMTTYMGTGAAPIAIAYDGTDMWTANFNDNDVTKIAQDGTMTTYPGTGEGPSSIAYDGTDMWTSNFDERSVTKIAQDGTMTTYSGTGTNPLAIASDGLNMWTVNYDGSGSSVDDTVTKISATLPSHSPNYSITSSSPSGPSTVGITLDNYALTAGETATVTFTFPIPPASFDLSDVTAQNGALSDLETTSDPAVYTATFTPTSGITASMNAISVNSDAVIGTFPDPGNAPVSLASDGANVWVANTGDSTVVEFDPTGAVVATYHVGIAVGLKAIAYDGTEMWITTKTDKVIKMNPLTTTGAGTTYMLTAGRGFSGAMLGGIVSDGTNMWVANTGNDSVTRINEAVGTITDYALPAGTMPNGIAFDGHNIWTADGDGTITKINSSGGLILGTYTIGSDVIPESIAYDGTDMWTANNDNSVSKITAAGEITTYAGTSPEPAGIAFDGTNMWTANGDNSVSVISPTGSVTTYANAGPDPYDIAFDGTNMWTANAGGNSVSKIVPTGASSSDNYIVDTVDTSGGGGSGGYTGGSSAGGSGSESGPYGGTLDQGAGHGGPLAPTLTEITAVPATTTDTTPNYTYRSTESGLVAYGGDCSSESVSAMNGLNTITFRPLSNGFHSACVIQETDTAGRTSNVLHITSFTVNGPVAAPAVPTNTYTPWVPPSTQTSSSLPASSTAAKLSTSQTTFPKPAYSPLPAGIARTDAPATSIQTPVPVVPSSNSAAPVVQTSVPALMTPATVAAVAGSGSCPVSNSNGVFGTIASEISWRWCVTKPKISSGFAHIRNAYETKNGDFISKILALIGVLGAALMVFSSGLFLDPLSFTDIILIPGRLWSLLLESTGFKKRRAAWGRVYDSITKQPLDPVRLELRTADGTKIASTVTRIDGTFAFSVPAVGSYTIAVKKNYYTFPSTTLASLPHDEVYRNIYTGAAFTAPVIGAPVAMNIPVDPNNFEWKTFAEKNGSLMKAYALGDRMIAHFAGLFLFVGLIVSVLALVMDPSVYACAVFVAALLIALIKPMTLSARHFGYVSDAASGEPLSFGIVRIETEAGTPITDVVASATGKYTYAVPKGNYLVRIDKKLPDSTYHTVTDGLPVQAGSGYVSKSFAVSEKDPAFIPGMLAKW